MSKYISLCLSGQLELWDQEKGHAHPEVRIGGCSITSEIEEMLRKANIHLESDPLQGPNEGVAAGEWILTLVRYKDICRQIKT